MKLSRSFHRRSGQDRRTNAPAVRRIHWWDGESLRMQRAPIPVRSVLICQPSFLEKLDASPAVLMALCLFGVLATACVVSHSKIVRVIWQRSHQTAEAEKLIRAGGISASNQEVFFNACKETPDKPHLLRALAKACVGDDPAMARRCYNRIAELQASMAEDEASHAVLLAKLADFQGAYAILAHAKHGSSVDPALEKAALAVARESGDFVEANRVLESLAKAKQSDVDECLETAEAAVHAGVDGTILERLEAHSLDAFERESVRGRHMELGSRAERLTCLPFKQPALRARAVQILQHLPNTTVELRLALAIFAHGEAGGSHEELRRLCIEELQRSGGFSAREKERVAAMLQRRAEYALVVDLITQPESFTERPLFECRLDALLNLGQWREAATMVSDLHAPKMAYGRTLCRTLTQLRVIPGSNAIALNLLDESLKEAIAEKSASACYTIGCIAVEQHLGALTEEAFANAVAISKGKDYIVENIINTSRQGGMSVSDLLNTLTRGATATAINPAMERRLCYLRLLAGSQSEAAHHFISLGISRAPDDAYLHFLAAFESYTRGDFISAAQKLIPLPQHSWHQGEAAVIASVMASAGQFNHSAGLIRQIDFSRLFQEERTLIEPWRTRLMLSENGFQQKLQASNP